MHGLKLCLLMVSVLMLNSCQSTGFGALNALSGDDGSERIATEIFAAEQGLQLDVYRGSDADEKTLRPVVVFFYGGSWDSGKRQWYAFVGNALARAGYIAVLPDYRQFPNVRFPSFVADAASAVAYVEKRAASWGGDPQKIYLMGHSAGAHIAMLLALDQHYLLAAGGDSSRLLGIIGVAGPYDFLPLKDADLVTIFGDAASQQRSQPINFARTDAPSLLLLHGADDKTVEPANSERLAAQQIAMGAPVSLQLYPDVGHIGILLDLRKKDSRVMRDVAEFIAR